MRTNLDKRIAVASFGIACTIGLVGAFVGLDVSSFGMDELNTAWVFEAGIGFREFLARFLTDLHPPVYYVLAFLHVRLFGDDEVALRGLSAALGVAAVLLFCTATRFYFSLAARLFAAAMATGSFFWFYQTQNARSYTLSLLIGVGILAISLSVLAGADRPVHLRPAPAPCPGGPGRDASGPVGHVREVRHRSILPVCVEVA